MTLQKIAMGMAERVMNDFLPQGAAGEESDGAADGNESHEGAKTGAGFGDVEGSHDPAMAGDEDFGSSWRGLRRR